ncbi:MAG: SDR family oxidoreductase [Actinomycetota bacterium]
MSTALVTGATAGLGAAFARALAKDSHDLVLVARDESRLESAKVALEDQFGVGVAVLPADLTTDAGCGAVAARLSSTEKPVETLINNAGIGTYRPFGVAELAREESMLDLNVRAVLRLTHASVRAMQSRGRGLIINVSSVASFVPRGSNATYSASKAWVTMFSEALAVQVAGSGVIVSALCPGFTRTEFHERAEADMSAVPGWMWLDADAVVAQGLADARAGKPVSVPSAKYKALVGTARHIPRPLLRAIMQRAGR